MKNEYNKSVKSSKFKCIRVISVSICVRVMIHLKRVIVFTGRVIFDTHAFKKYSNTYILFNIVY